MDSPPPATTSGGASSGYDRARRQAAQGPGAGDARLKKLLAETLLEQAVTQAQLQQRRRTRKKVPVGARQPLVRPDAANAVWSLNFVFDRFAEGRVIKCVTIVDDATHESIAIVPERAISGQQVTQILDHATTTHGLPQVVRTDNGKEFCGRAMLTWVRATRSRCG